MERIKFQEDLLNWYHLNHRKLPWRESHDPYLIWLSEIMLQQTQVATVIEYFNRFTKAYPNVFSLAVAQEDDVFKLWEGLGYYSRARNLMKCARILVSEYQGQFPKNERELLKLPGIGPYTAGAILSIAYNIKAPAVDGNVFRVYSRLYALQEDIAQPKTRLIFEAIVKEDLPEDARHFNQALMELGATVCTPKTPKCGECPVNDHCKAYELENVTNYPVKTKNLKRSFHKVAVGLITCDHQILLIKRPPEGLLASLWGFPAVELPDETVPTEEKHALINWIGEYLDVTDIKISKSPLSSAKHVFTHKTWQMNLWQVEIPEKVLTDFPEMIWVDPHDISKYALPTAFIKLVGKNIFRSLNLNT